MEPARAALASSDAAMAADLLDQPVKALVRLADKQLTSAQP